jgi:hypothetical protein
MMIEPLVTFLPSFGSLAPQLFAEVFTNEGMRVELPTMMLVFLGEESCSS